MSQSLAMCIFAGMLALFGVGIFIVGIVGRRCGTQVFCLRCGFDVHATIDHLAAGGAPRPCPECGSSLINPRAVRRGSRVRHWRRAGLGAVFFLVGSAGLAWIAAPGMMTTNLNQRKPTWLLMLEARFMIARASTGVLKELLQRETTGALDNDHMRDLVRSALRAQADQTHAWDTQWGDLIEIAHRRGLTSDDQCNEFMQRAVMITVSCRPVVRQNAATMVSWQIEPARGPTRDPFTSNGLLHRLRLVRCAAMTGDAELQSVQPSDHVSYSHDGTFGADLGGRTGSALAWTMPVGMYDVQLDAAAEVGFHDMRRADAGWRVAVSRRAALVIVPADRPAARAVADARIAAELRTGMTVEVSVRRQPVWDAKLGRLIEVCQPVFGVRLKSPATMPLALSCTLRESGNSASPEWMVPQIMIEPGISGSGALSQSPRSFECQTVDVVLRTSLDAAESSATAFTVWDGEVIFQNVPVGTGGMLHSSREYGFLPTSVQSPAPTPVLPTGSP